MLALQNIRDLVFPLCTKVGKAAIGDIIPGGGTLVAIAEFLKEFDMTSKNERADCFHKKMLSEEPIEEEVIERNFSIDDYYNILRHCLNDEEKIKTDMYAKLYNAILAGKIQQKEKIALIKSIKDLTYDDIIYLKNKYVKNYAIVNDVKRYEERFYVQHEIKQEYIQDGHKNSIHVHRLAGHGLVYLKSNISIITDIGKTLVETLFSDNEITPEWVHVKQKPKNYAFITWKHDFDSAVFSKLEELIASNGFEQSNGAFEILFRRKSINIGMHHRYCNVFIVILSVAADQTTKDDYMDVFSSKICERCIFVEYIKSKDMTKGLWTAFEDASQKIFYIERNSKCGEDDLGNYLKSIRKN